jgi:hypothetical protein
MRTGAARDAKITLAIAALLFGCAAWSAGCAGNPRDGYTFSSSRVEGVRTVNVPMFRNRTNAPGLEQELTEAIIKEIQASTDMRVVQASSAGSAADSALSGTITKADLRTLSLRDGTGLVQEVAVQIVVDFAWTRTSWGADWNGSAGEGRREAGTLVARQNFVATDTFVPSRPIGERLEVGESAAIQRMAKAIVSEMRSAW